jgi:hypothetical protein
MITDLILLVLGAPFRWLLDTIPAIDWPTWITDGTLADRAANVAGYVAGLDNWIPVDLLGTAIGIVGVAFLFSITVQALRFVVSLFSGGGGAT